MGLLDFMLALCSCDFLFVSNGKEIGGREGNADNLSPIKWNKRGLDHSRGGVKYVFLQIFSMANLMGVLKLSEEGRDSRRFQIRRNKVLLRI